jgi:peptidoglycan/LPS O-acetylase OafA/YrhL
MRYPYLDSLRGWAVCGVVLIHASQQIADLPPLLSSFAGFGFRGVQLFFIVSALTLFSVSDRANFNAARFYVHRFFRIAPMFYLAAIFYLAARAFGWMDFAPDGIRPLDVISTFLFVHGVVPEAINNVVPGGWSIYLLFPLALAFITSLRRSLMLPGFVIVLPGILLPMLGKVVQLDDPVMTYFLPFSFIANAPPFAVGIVLFFVLQKTARVARPGALGIVLPVGLFAAMCAFATFSEQIPLAELLFIPLLAAFAAIAACYQPPLIVNRPFSFLGEISFSLYLIHFAVLHYVALWLPASGQPAVDLGMVYFVTMAISSALALCTFTLVERPLIRQGRWLTRRKAAPLHPVSA